MYELQSGFQPGFSTDTCLIHLTDYIKSEMDKGNYTELVLLDLQKAFDTVDHSILDQNTFSCRVPQGSLLCATFIFNLCQRYGRRSKM